MILHYYTVSTQYLHTIYIVSTQVRRELYSQCFDEIIRQTTIVCLERGLLLLRTRDEFRLTVHACMVSWSVAWPHLVTVIHSLFQTLFQQSTNNGFKNTSKNEKKNIELIAKIKLLEGNIKCLKNEAIDLREEIVRREKISKRDSEHRLKMRRQTCDAIHKANLQLKRQIEAIKQNKNNVGGKHL